MIRAAELLAGDGALADLATVSTSSLPAAFSAAMDDDLAVPQALAIVHESVREGNAALAAGDAAGTAKCLVEVRAMLAVLGLDPLAAPWTAEQARRRPAAGRRRADRGRTRAAAGGTGAQGLRRR